MSKAGLTRRELGWLLAEEARGAAKALREGVTQMSHHPPPEISTVPPMESSLDTLEDAIGLLSQLEGAPVSRRRGRIDWAALVYEVAPGARISIEPGAGTEVFGEERDFRRILRVFLGPAAGDMPSSVRVASPEIRIRREGDSIKTSVHLGPDTSAAFELERRWLSRMAVQLGGSFELAGGVETLLLPADVSSNQREVVELRQELAEAQELGETYARELANVLTTTSSLTTRSKGAPDETQTAAASLRALVDFVHALEAQGMAPAGIDLEGFATIRLNAPYQVLDLEAVASTEVDRARAGIGSVAIKIALSKAPAVVVAPVDGLKLLVRQGMKHVLDTRQPDSIIEVRIEVLDAALRLHIEDNGPVADGPSPSITCGVPWVLASNLAGWIGAKLDSARRGSRVRLTLEFARGA